MNRLYRNEKGVTLVEMLAAISITALIVVMITSTHIFVQNQFNNQRQELDQINDLTYVLKLITNDFRKTPPAAIEVIDERNINLGTEHYSWDMTEEALYKNGQIIVRQIESFFVTEHEQEIHLTIKQTDQEEKMLILTRREESD